MKDWNELMEMLGKVKLDEEDCTRGSILVGKLADSLATADGHPELIPGWLPNGMSPMCVVRILAALDESFCFNKYLLGGK